MAISTTDAILACIRQGGYVVKVFRVNGTVEMHAIKLDCTVDPQIARCNDGNGPEEEYRCACVLAEARGFKLDDG